MTIYRQILRTISFFFLILTGSTIYGAVPTPDQNSLIAKLAQDPQWLKLLHFDSSAGSSEIISPDFFISSQGRFDPASELLATMEQLKSDQNLDSDQHGQCRFPARYQWLKRKLDWQQEAKAQCRAFNEWAGKQQIDSLSLIYATGYLDNPASFYGHLLLRLNSQAGDFQGNLLDTSIDYGAIIPEQESPLVYIAKGLSGGYEAGFTQGTFYEQTQTYGNIELRDMWDYRLLLDADDTRLITSHIWELLGKKFTYYYLTKNCAYRIVELIQLVTDAPLLDINKSWVPPVDLLKQIKQQSHRGAPLIGSARYIPSRQKRFYNKYRQLTENQKRALFGVIENAIHLDIPDYLDLQVTEQMAIVDILFDYVELRINNTDLPEYQEAKRRLLQEMLKLSSHTEFEEVTSNAPEPPDKGQNSSAIRIAATHHQTQDYLELGFRGSYFDLLNLDAGRMPMSQLMMMDISLQLHNDNLQLERLDLLNLRTYGLPNTGLPGDNRNAWNLRVGWDKPDQQCSNCTIASIDAGYGWSRMLNDQLAWNLLLGGRFAQTTGPYGNFAGTVSTEFLFSASPAYRALLRYTRNDYINSGNINREQFLLEQRFGNDPEWDIRLTYQKAVADEFSVGFNMYF
ncbi:Lnb N-terminal periplasmic domain-containing protein [Amphritea sp. HPY]|uniref:Lnb N-terminal periplasmic domain-containing protein n=1 Tax=Amphritea sp. HPY TaxID=3421652 RepID=UPI003D7C8271